jgi:predicted ATPase
LLSLVGDDTTLAEQADEVEAVSVEQALPYWRSIGTIYRGWAKAKMGDVTEAVSLLRDGSSAYGATGARTWMPHHLALLAKAHEMARQDEAAATALDEASRIVETTGERWFAAEVYRHKGGLMRRQGHTDTAEELYRKALSIAHEQEARLWELRAAASLAQIHLEQGRHAEARGLLAPIHGWFSEGFGTADLVWATALLDELT